MDTYYVNKYIIIAIIIVIIILLALLFYQNQYYDIQLNELYTDNNYKCPKCPKCPQASQPVIIQEQREMPISPVDPIRQYDYRKMYDPLEDPRKRVPRDEIPPLPFKRLIDFPTRGFPDNFNQMGIMVKTNGSRNDPNNILRLFGRQEFPGSTRYEYYTMVNSGPDQIKIPIRTRGKEIYSGDNIVVTELGNTYNVRLYQYDAPRYYPDIL